MSHIRPAVCTLALFTVLTGLLYPLLVTGIANLVFPHQARGSLIVCDGRTVGSELIGQEFTGTRYFWGRLSATAPTAYNASSSGGSNYAPGNPRLIDAARRRALALRQADPELATPVPADLVTASGSGLDPHISPAAAMVQAPRVARSRSMSEDQVEQLVRQYTEPRQLGFLGEPRVNVLRINMALDGAR